jgi:hypothetical protein
MDIVGGQSVEAFQQQAISGEGSQGPCSLPGKAYCLASPAMMPAQRSIPTTPVLMLM